MSWIINLITQHQTVITLWVGAAVTFGIYSILYKENPYYRFCEHIFIGLTNGLAIYLTWKDVLKPQWWDPMVGKGQWWWVLTVPAGLTFYFIYSKRNAWISRLMMGVLFGIGAGMAFQSFAGLYFPMIKGSFKPVIPGPALSWPAAWNNLVFVIVLVTVMAYFFFSIDHKAKSVKTTAALGRWFLMFAFGAMFGATVMARMSLFIGRIDFLTNDWAPIVGFWGWVVLAVLALIGVGLYLYFRTKPPTKKPGVPTDDVEPQAVTE